MVQHRAHLEAAYAELSACHARWSPHANEPEHSARLAESGQLDFPSWRMSTDAADKLLVF